MGDAENVLALSDVRAERDGSSLLGRTSLLGSLQMSVNVRAHSEASWEQLVAGGPAHHFDSSWTREGETETIGFE